MARSRRFMVAAFAVCAAVAYAALAPTRVSAQQARLLEPVPAACPNSDWLERELDIILGADRPTGAPVDVQLSARDRNWQATIALPTGTRTIEATTCEGAAHAAAVVFAVAMAPERVRVDAIGERGAPTAEPVQITPGRVVVRPSRATEIRPESSPQPSESLSAPRVTVPRARDDSRENTIAPPAPPRTQRAVSYNREPSVWAAGIGGFGSAGDLPSVGPGLSVHGTVQRARWALDLGASYAFRRRRQASAVHQGAFDLALASLDVCRALFSPVSACLGAEAGVLRATGEGPGRMADANALWLGARGSVGASVDVSQSFHVFGRGSAIAPVRRGQFVIEGVGLVFEPRVIAARFETGVEVEL